MSFRDYGPKNPHMARPGGGLKAEVHDLRRDVQDWSDTIVNQNRADIYVASTGSDVNNGLSASSPLATFEAAVAMVPRNAAYPFVIHGASGTYTWTRTLAGRALEASVVVIGDGAGQPGDDGLTEVQAASAAAAGSGTQVVVTSGLTTNALAGKTIEILSGAAEGNRRTIRNNTTTNIIPARNFKAAVADGDSFRIVEPALVFSFASPALVCDGVGAPVGFGRHIGPTAVINFPAMHFMSCEFAGASFSNIPYFAGSRLALTGVKFSEDLAAFGCHILSGSDIGWLNRTPAELFGVAEDDWAGWGINFAASGTQDLADLWLQGYFVASDCSMTFRRCEVLMKGGGIIENGGGVGDAIATVENSNLILDAVLSPRCLLQATIRAIDLETNGGPHGSSSLFLQNTDLESGTDAMRLAQPVSVVIGSNVETVGPPSNGIRAGFGAVVQFEAAPAAGFVGTAGSDISVDDGSTYSAISAVLTGAYTQLFNSNDGTLIQRMS